jgi:hypothetical protein
MKTRRTGIILLALLLAAMITVPCISAANNLMVVSADTNATMNALTIEKSVSLNKIPPALPKEILYSTPRLGSASQVSYNKLAGLSPDYSISLVSGWNVISVPRTLADGHNTAGDVFNGIDTGGHSTLEYDGATQTWITVTNSTIIRPLDGIFIYSVETPTIQLYFKNDPRQRLPIKPVFQGWNLIGFSDIYPKTAHDTLISIDSIWTQVMGYNAATQSYETQIIHGGSGDYSDTRLMNPGKGYWLYTTGSGTLVALS